MSQEDLTTLLEHVDQSYEEGIESLRHEHERHLEQLRQRFKQSATELKEKRLQDRADLVVGSLRDIYRGVMERSRAYGTLIVAAGNPQDVDFSAVPVAQGTRPSDDEMGQLREATVAAQDLVVDQESVTVISYFAQLRSTSKIKSDMAWEKKLPRLFRERLERAQQQLATADETQ